MEYIKIICLILIIKLCNSNNNNDDIYNFDDVMDYYDNRKEFKFIGIIDKETNRRKSKRTDEIKDVFKIREQRDKVLEKKRGTSEFANQKINTQ